MIKVLTAFIFQYTQLFVLLMLVALIFNCGSLVKEKADLNLTTNQLTQYGITWTFSESVEFGTFITGDYYIVDPGTGVTVTSISPLPSNGANGSMKNPVPGAGQGLTDGYDYDASLSIVLPLDLNAGDSLLSSITRDGTESRDWAGGTISSQAKLRTVAVLTVLSEHPPTGTFRPSYSDRSQTLYNINQINLDILPGKPVIGNQPAVEYFERGMERPWILFGNDWMSRAIHPLENMNNYHEQIGFFLSEASLLLTTNQATDTLRNNFIQVGIDYYYNTSDSAIWAWPVVFTGLLLNEPGMYNFWIDNPRTRTQRGHEKLYYIGDIVESRVSAIIPQGETWVDWKTNTGKFVAFRKQAGEEYAHLHPSEWVCQSDCKSEIYRAQHDVYPLIGLTLSSILIDNMMAEDVNAMLAHDPIRDYADRWMSDVFNTGIYEPTGETYRQEMENNQIFTIYHYNYGSGGSLFAQGSGWHIDKCMTTDLVYKAMVKTYNLRQSGKGLVYLTDRGSQYTSKHYRKLVTSYHIRTSMGDVGACWDNAVVGRFFGSLKHDWIVKLLNQHYNL